MPNETRIKLLRQNIAAAQGRMASTPTYLRADLRRQIKAMREQLKREMEQ